MNLLLDTDERESKLPAKYHIPDCSRPDAIRDWDYHEMTADERDYLIKLSAQPLAADRLGSTHAMDQMSTLFSAKTGRPTCQARCITSCSDSARTAFCRPAASDRQRFRPQTLPDPPNGSRRAVVRDTRPCEQNHGTWHVVKCDPNLPNPCTFDASRCLPLRPARRTRRGLTLQADIVVGRVDTQRRRIVYERGEG